MDKHFKSFEERQEYLRRVNAIHNEWTDAHANDEGVFDPSHSQPHDPTDDNTDYPIFYLDRSAPADVENEFYDRVAELDKEFFKRSDDKDVSK